METLEMSIQETLPTARDFETLYEMAFPGVAAFVSKMNGTFDDAKDIFHDALVIFHEKEQSENFTINVPAEAYVLGIAKHLWLKKFKKTSRHIPLDSMEANIAIPEDYFPSVNDLTLLAVLERTGKKCLDILQAFYYEKMSLKNLAQALGFSSVHSATVQKYKCLEKVRDTVKEKSISYEDFFE
ncbi:RNA polymerase sigma factor [Chryseolinea lacunae]|uniref:Sigma-70 family RNA polymerase sigma factor n=1 Tax=Chryseolinea lacunae TaxID=2801331 RepID=A0ABS1KX85_9BACT|nr:sigma-70 family RNA polymerase sigma factor [Chryseolinea lacunae]MBL0743302.1 sigma-70 family RNA polymerase sigma factor [Chryseolinea lacunae]